MYYVLRSSLWVKESSSATDVVLKKIGKQVAAVEDEESILSPTWLSLLQGGGPQQAMKRRAAKVFAY